MTNNSIQFKQNILEEQMVIFALLDNFEDQKKLEEALGTGHTVITAMNAMHLFQKMVRQLLSNDYTLRSRMFDAIDFIGREERKSHEFDCWPRG